MPIGQNKYTEPAETGVFSCLLIGKPEVSKASSITESHCRIRRFACPEFPAYGASVSLFDTCAVLHQLENVMHYLLLIGVMLWLLFLAPLKVTLLTAISVAVITALIRHLAYSMNGVTVYFGDAAKAIGNSFIFLVVSVFTLLSFLKGSGVTHISGLPGLAVLGAFLAAYVLGFQVSLRLSFGASSAIALASTAASTGAFFLARSIL